MKHLSTQELRQTQLAILDAVDAYCREREISYFIFAGSLIGAVRHKGYIPWDDDLDICMLREDYERFIASFPSQGDARFQVRSMEHTPGYYLAAAKVIDTETTLTEFVRRPIPLGVNLDIFPLDSLPEEEEEIRRLDRRLAKYRRMLILKNIKRDANRSFWKNAVLSCSALLLLPVSRRLLLKKISAMAQCFRGDERCTNLGDISVFTYGMKEVFPKEDFSASVPLEFEGRTVPAPTGYQRVLTRMYGDYMQLPPEDKRKTHHAFTAYRK